MTHKIVFTNKAVKDLKSIPNSEQRRIGTKLKEFGSDPIHHARKLKNSEIGEYRFRVGNYRIIFDLDGDTIVILRVGHRSDIYK